MAEVATRNLRGRRKDPNILLSYLKQAYEWERENEDRVVLYCGESYGVWLLQLLLKESKYPNSKDWLPLRFNELDTKINATDLLLLRAKINYGGAHAPEFRDIGLSANWNLVSERFTESAWGMYMGQGLRMMVSTEWAAAY